MRFVLNSLASLGVLGILSIALMPFAVAETCHSTLTIDPETGQVCSFDCTRATCTKECTENWRMVGDDVVWGCKCWDSWAEDCCRIYYVEHPTGPDTIVSSGNCSAQDTSCPTGVSCISYSYMSGGLAICLPVCIP